MCIDTVTVLHFRVITVVVSNLEFYWGVANGKFRDFSRASAQEHADSHTIPLHTEGFFRLRLYLLLMGRLYNKGAAGVGVKLCSYLRRDVICYFRQSTKHGGRCYWAISNEILCEDGVGDYI